MRVLVCGNRCEHEWPESCVRALGRLGHEARLVDYRWPAEGELARWVPAAVQPDVPWLLDRPEGRRALMEQVFVHQALEWRPDLVLLAGMVHLWSADALCDVREALGVPVVLWSGDSPFEPWAPDVFARAPHLDQALFTIQGMAERVADRFEHTGFLPFACDPERDAPPAEPEAVLAPYRCDVGYLGSIKLDRAALLDDLARSGVDLKVWGVGFPADAAERFPALARARQAEHVQGERKRRVYGAARITLNLHHTGFANMKLWEAAACGAFQVSNLRAAREALEPELPFLARVPAYADPRELPGLVRHWLDRPEERAAEAAELRRIVCAEHTWEHRIETILGLVADRAEAVAAGR